jgi:putative tryptophan/tyrosine transport system substrate-binding protein
MLICLATAKRLALATFRKEAIQEGALFSYAPNVTAVGRRAATFVDRILRGAKPADLPVERPSLLNSWRRCRVECGRPLAGAQAYR